MLARLRNVKVEDVRSALERDAGDYAAEGLYLEHLWQNDDDPDEVFFLFRTSDVAHARAFVRRVHSETRRRDTKANLPTITFLVDNEAGVPPG